MSDPASSLPHLLATAAAAGPSGATNEHPRTLLNHEDDSQLLHALSVCRSEVATECRHWLLAMLCASSREVREVMAVVVVVIAAGKSC